MAIDPRAFRLMKNVAPRSILFAMGLVFACSRKEAPELLPAVPPAQPASPAPIVKDAAPDVADAASDASDARRHGGKATGAPAGGGGLKVEGSLSRADADKVVRGAAGKLRGCFEEANAKGPGRKGKVSFKMTVDDRGHVTFAEIPVSTLPGGSDVETCMVRALRDLRFPRAGGESSVSFQMSFGR
jgi:hypothetical protein